MGDTGQKIEEEEKIDIDKLRKLPHLNSEAVDERSALLMNSTPTEPPPDLCWMTYMIFYLHGIGHLLPWNFFITANEYFSVKFGCTPEPGAPANSTPFNATHCDFENYFSVAAMLPIFIMTGINIWLQSRIHYMYRMVLALLVMFAVFIFTTALIPVHTDPWRNGFFAVTLISVVLINSFSAIFQSSTFGFAGVFPPKYTSVVMSGQACAGIFAALADILSKVAGKSQTSSAIGYFSTAVFVIFLCLLSIFILRKLKFVKHYLSKTSVKSKQAKQEAAVKHSMNARAVKTSVPYFTILSEIFVFGVSVFLVFAVTLSVFPGVISLVRSTSSDPSSSAWTSTYFTPLVCFLLFNVTDFVGRLITHWIMIGSHRFVLLGVAVLRLGFIPLFMLCNADPTSQDRGFSAVFNSDVWPVVFTFLLGLSNGYLGTVCMIRGPTRVPTDQQETAGTMMAFFLSGGLLAGGVTSFLWTYLLVV